MRNTSYTAIFAFFLFAAIPAAALLTSIRSVLPNPALFSDEAQTVYLGNLARRQNGVPPLRWNRQLTLAARWFSWDSTENEPGDYCNHLDLQGKWPSDRVVRFGYPGFGGAENAFCGYVTPD